MFRTGGLNPFRGLVASCNTNGTHLANSRVAVNELVVLYRNGIATFFPFLLTVAEAPAYADRHG